MAYYPYNSFHFEVEIDGFKEDISFQSVKGLEMQLDVENIKEGGLNTFEHNIPTRVKYTTLTLERGVFKPERSALIKWCQSALNNFEFQPRNITVKLFTVNELVKEKTGNEPKNTPIITWNIKHAYPKSWKIKDMSSTQNEVLIETLELQYNSFTMEGISPF
jgi:phage tail-like protein